jgi:hypothetical protein
MTSTLSMLTASTDTPAAAAMDRRKTNRVSPVLNACKVMGSLTAMFTTAQDGAGVDERAAEVAGGAGVLEEVVGRAGVDERAADVVGGAGVLEEVVGRAGVDERAADVVGGAGVLEEVVGGATDEDTHVSLEEAPVAVENVPAPQCTQAPTVGILEYVTLNVPAGQSSHL